MNDIIVIGGGPAGSTSASFLAMKGHRVLLLEKEKFPRDHVGESLLPFCYNLLGELGVLEQMKGSFVRKPGVRFIDKDGVSTTTWCFDHVIHDQSSLSFQVVRREFDQMLLDNARRLGVEVQEETRVNGVDLEREDGRVAVRAVGPDGEQQTHVARFVLDCSGRSAFLAGSQGVREKYPALDRTALWTHFGGVELAGGLEQGMSLIVYLGGEKKGWMWVFPLGLDEVTVGVVLNNDYIRAQRAALETAGAEDWKQALFDQEVGYSPFVGRLLAGTRMVKPLVVEGNYSYYSETKYGENFAMVGDAASFIDPIFSSGIYLAMRSARLVSEAVHQKLSDGAGAGSNSLEEAYGHINGAYKMVYKLIQFFYSTNVINFAQMESMSGLVYEQHKEAMATGHFLLAGDFFDRYDRYSEVIDSLKRPNLFEAYKKMVLDRSHFQVTSCDEPEEAVFPGANGKGQVAREGSQGGKV
ncbi:MAG: NAD(P)/FAD-dependent oxidoreductase [Candidatus Promineifilaceae bacterium]